MQLITNIFEILQDHFYIAFLIGVTMLIWGGNLLIEGSVAIAKKLGVSALVIGLTIVAFSTSSPELALNIIASMNNHGSLCLGNIFGSNIANIGLVLGIGALICKLPVTGQVVKKEFPWLIIATCFVGGAALFRTLNWIWAICFLIFFAFLMRNWFTLGQHKESKVGEQSDDIVPEVTCSATAAMAMLFFGLVLLTLGGKATEIGAVTSAIHFGMSEILVGSTIVAIATSLPEVVTTIIAAKKKHPDLAVGNVVGSNIFNILLVLPITLFVNPIQAPENIWFYALIMIIMTVLAYVLTLDHRLKSKEGSILIAMYIAFLIGSAFI